MVSIRPADSTFVFTRKIEKPVSPVQILREISVGHFALSATEERTAEDYVSLVELPRAFSRRAKGQSRER